MFRLETGGGRGSVDPPHFEFDVEHCVEKEGGAGEEGGKHQEEKVAPNDGFEDGRPHVARPGNSV